MITKIINSNEFIKTSWSGGDTTEFIIYPNGSTLSKRDFDFRISSATFTSTSSTFSDYTGYERYILPLTGKLSVSHEGLYERNLSAYELEYFMGDWTTNSTNTLDCADFNFIVKKDCHSNLSILESQSVFVPKKNGVLCIYSRDEFSIVVNESEKIEVSSNSLLYIEEDITLYNIKVEKSNSPVIFCEFSK